MSGVIGVDNGRGIVAERRRAPSGDVKAALLGALFSAIPHRPLMRYGEHSCKKAEENSEGGTYGRNRALH